MISHTPAEAIKIENHDLSTSKIDETADSTKYGGINILLEIALHFQSSVQTARTVILYKTKDGVDLLIQQWADYTDADLVKTYSTPVNLPDGWVPKLTVSKLPNGSPLMSCTGHVIIKRND